MGDRPITVLLVEDNPGDARLVREMLLEAQDVRFDATWVDSLATALEALSARPFDIVLLDLTLPDSSGFDTIHGMRGATDAPIVVLTGLDDAETAVRMVKEGCQDYLVKGHGDADLLRRTLLYSIERKRSEEALRRSEERYRELIEITPEALVLATGGGIIYANPAAVTLFYADDMEGLRGRPLSDLMTPRDRDVGVELQAMLEAGERDVKRLECTMLTIDGGAFDAEITAVCMDFDEEAAVQLIIRDVTERKEIERRQRLAATVFQTSGEAMMIVDADNKIIAVNPAFTQITGYNPEDVIGKDPSILSSGRHPQDYYEEMWEVLARDRHWRGDMWNRRKDGELYVQRATISEILDEDGQVTNYVCVFTDVTEERAEAEEAQFRATHDALTRLPNRLLLTDRVQHAIATATRANSEVAVLFIDLDGFKPVNDTKGHVVGDLVLQEVAARLHDSVREGDTVARIGGDEFVIVANVTEARDAAAKVAAKVLHALGRPIKVEGEDEALKIGCSIGIAIFPGDGEEVETLVHKADMAMYAAKRAGKGRYRFHDDKVEDAEGQASRASA